MRIFWERGTRQAGDGWNTSRLGTTSPKEIGKMSRSSRPATSDRLESSCLTVADLNLFQDNVIASEQMVTAPKWRNVAPK